MDDGTTLIFLLAPERGLKPWGMCSKRLERTAFDCTSGRFGEHPLHSPPLLDYQVAASFDPTVSDSIGGCNVSH